MSFGLGDFAEVPSNRLAEVEGGKAKGVPRLVVDLDAEEAAAWVRVDLARPSTTT
jgi:hypothetical protein